MIMVAYIISNYLEDEMKKFAFFDDCHYTKSENKNLGELNAPCNSTVHKSGSDKHVNKLGLLYEFF